MSHEIYGGNGITFLKMAQEYFEKFPEVENKMEIFVDNKLNNQDKIEQFLIYAYWYFDEYYSMTLRFGQDKTVEAFEKIAGELWEKIEFQFEFFYKYRAFACDMQDMTYQEFSLFASNLKNHKLDFFKVK